MVVSVTLRQLSFLLGRDFLSRPEMCLMFAGFKRVAPEHAVGMELEEPFFTALDIFNRQRGAA